MSFKTIDGVEKAICDNPDCETEIEYQEKHYINRFNDENILCEECGDEMTCSDDWDDRDIFWETMVECSNAIIITEIRNKIKAWELLEPIAKKPIRVR